jgi:type I restriction enzyme S subunit
MMQTSKGAKMPRGDKQAIMRKAVVVPAYELQNYFSKLVRNFFNLIVENKKQNESLTMLRDTLLPKLLAGEIHTD